LVIEIPFAFLLLWQTLQCIASKANNLEAAKAKQATDHDMHAMRQH